MNMTNENTTPEVTNPTLAHEKPLTLEQAGKYQSLQIPFDNVGLMSGSFQGEQVGIMFAEDNGRFEPLAIMLDKEFMARFKGQLLDMNGQEVASQNAPSIIIDPSTLDQGMIQSVLSGMSAGNQ